MRLELIVQHSLMDLIEKSGDDSLGASLIRLARQATSVHMLEVSKMKSRHGSLAEPVVAIDSDGSDHKEVNR